MTAPEPDPDADELGPIDYLAVEFPAGRITGDGFSVLLDLVDRRVIRVLDLEFLTKNAEDVVELVSVDALEAEPGVDLAPFQGASSGLIDQLDIDEVGAAIARGSVAALLVYEERSIRPLLDAWRHSGARVVAEGQVSSDQLLSALDATEPG